jgi:lysophospholipase L1-like esterase
MTGNKINNAAIFTAAVVAGALLLSFIPGFDLGGIELKKPDVLADIRKRNNVSGADTLPNIKPENADTCKAGIICFDDYSTDHNSLDRFYEALWANHPVRIAYFGDSFIEGDILTGSLRYLFQEKYGGNGAGFVPISSLTSGFRTTVLTSADGWEEHCLTDSVFDRKKQGISGYYFIPQINSSATYSSRTASRKETDTCSEASFYFITDGDLKFTTAINRQAKEQHIAEGSADIQKVSVRGRIGQIKIIVDNPGRNTRFFGVTMDDRNRGVIVDNYSLRGVSGEALESVPEKTFRDFDKLRSYDLVILQYGLNVATKTGNKYDYYKKGMVKVINYLRNNLPNSDFLLVSVGDRAAKIDGEMTTMPGVKNLLVTQQTIASECGIAFWNLMDVMDLDGGIVGYVNSKPSKANLDYTHINARGGDLVAKHLFETIEYGKEKYIEKKKQIKVK